MPATPHPRACPAFRTTSPAVTWKGAANQCYVGNSEASDPACQTFRGTVGGLITRAIAQAGKAKMSVWSAGVDSQTFANKKGYLTLTSSTAVGKAMLDMVKGYDFLACTKPLWGALSEAWASAICKNASVGHNVHVWINMDQMFVDPTKTDAEPELGMSLVKHEVPGIASCARITKLTIHTPQGVHGASVTEPPAVCSAMVLISISISN